MDATEVLAALPEYGATKQFEFAHGVELTIRAIQSFGEYRAIAKQVERVKNLGGNRVPVGEYTVTVDDEMMWACIYVQTAIQEPKFTYSQVVALATRAGAKFGELQAEIAKLSGLTIEQAVDAAVAEVASDPFLTDDSLRGDEDEPAILDGSDAVDGAGCPTGGVVDEAGSESE
jgi:hypothetical protein